MPKEILLNAFDMACVGHIHQGLWTHPRDRSSSYADLDYWTDYARQLEAGLFDGIFFADVAGVYDVYEGSPSAAVEGAVQVPVNDPTLVIPAMAAVTRNLSFGVTSNLSVEQPYLFARRMSTLDHLTKGRIGWNIVTGYLDSAARAIGLDAQMAHDDRYDLAEEYMELVYKLWEGSWEQGAVVRDRESGVYAESSKVHVIRHEGKQYRVNAMHLSEPSPQRTPVLYQAGSSARGKQFAATHAECVFLNGQAKAAVKQIVDDIRGRACTLGRASEDIKVFLGTTVVTGPTERAAREKFTDYQQYASSEAYLVHASASLGIDFSRYALDEPIETRDTQAIISNVEAMTRAAGPRWTKRKLLEQMSLGSRQTPLVGSAEQVADALMSWSEESGVDGFNLSRTVAPECFQDIVRYVIPILQERGAYKQSYREGTLREKLFGRAHLPLRHPGAAFRRGASCD